MPIECVVCHEDADGGRYGDLLVCPGCYNNGSLKVWLKEHNDMFDIAKKTLEEEVEHNSQFAKECQENNDTLNASYWKAFVHGVKFSLDVIDDSGKTEKGG